MEASKELVQAQFGKVANEYLNSASHGNVAVLDALMEKLQLESTWFCLDVATGGGHVAKALAKRTDRVIATDITVPMLETVRSHFDNELLHNVDFVQADAEALPFLSNTFDVVACRIAAHHFPHPEQFVKEAHRVLKPGGRFVFVDNVSPNQPECADFYNGFEKLRDPSHQRCLSVAEWETLFTASGFSIKEHFTRRKSLEFQPWMKRMAESDTHAKQVEDVLLNASSANQEAFSIQVENARVQSLAIDEWTAIAVKK